MKNYKLKEETIKKSKLTLGSEFVYDWLQVEIGWKLLLDYFDVYFGKSVETFARKRAVA